MSMLSCIGPPLPWHFPQFANPCQPAQAPAQLWFHQPSSSTMHVVDRHSLYGPPPPAVLPAATSPQAFGHMYLKIAPAHCAAFHSDTLAPLPSERKLRQHLARSPSSGHSCIASPEAGSLADRLWHLQPHLPPLDLCQTGTAASALAWTLLQSCFLLALGSRLWHQRRRQLPLELL